MGFLNAISQFAASATASIKTGGAEDMPRLDAQKKTHALLKEQVWGIASAQAKAEGRESVTWSDYQIAAQNEGVELAAQQGISAADWRVASINQDDVHIQQATIRKSELKPSADVRAEAIRRAMTSNAQTGAKPNIKDVIQQVRAISDAMEKKGYTPPKTTDAELNALENLYDLDGDHTVSGFYATNEKLFSFDGAHFEGVTFHPAGTLTEHHTQGASFKNCVFDGMSDKGEGLYDNVDKVKLQGGTYENIRFTNIKGGEIDIADGAQIHGMDISGARAKLTIGKAAIDNLKATDTRIISINAKPGAVISDSTLSGVTVREAKESTLQGIRLERVNLESVNLRDVDLRGATLNRVTMKDSDVKGVNFDGAKLNNVSLDSKTARGMHIHGAEIKNMSIDGKAIQSLADLQQAGINVDAKTKVTATPEFVAQTKINNLGVIKDLTAANKTLQKPQPVTAEPPTPQAPVIDRPVVAAPKAPEQKHEPVGALDELKYVKTPELAKLAATAENPFAAALQAGKQIADSWSKPSEPSAPAAPVKTAAAERSAIPANYYAPNQGRSGAA